MRKTLLTLAISLVVVVPVFAVEAAVSGSADVSGGQAPTEHQVTSPRDTATGQASGKRQYAPVNVIKEVREKAQAEVKDLREKAMANLRSDIEAKREDVKKEVEAKRAALQEKLKTVKDEHKKEVTERVDKRLGELNDNRTDHFSDVLEKLEKMLGRISDRADKMAAKGLDVSTVRTAIAAAHTAIDAAKAAVTAQAGKTYTITFTSESGLKGVLQAARKAFQDDVKKVFDAVKAAHDAVRKAAVTLAQIDKGNENENEGHATTTPATTTPSNNTQ